MLDSASGLLKTSHKVWGLVLKTYTACASSPQVPYTCIYSHWDTYPVKLGALLSLLVCFLSSAERAADPAMVLTSTIWVEPSSETTVKSRSAGLEQTQFVEGHRQVLYAGVHALDHFQLQY